MADNPTRKLAVILHADVVGSTALVQSNETVAHERIRDVFRRFSEMIVNYNGIAREIRGDAIVAEFARASDAVSASLAFQYSNAVYNDGLTDDIRPTVRIGIAMGEVVVADNTVTGEGVVLAQRLEQLAEQGTVCIQGAAYETVPKRLPFRYQNLGEQPLKGFDDPVRSYRVNLKDEATVPEPERTGRLHVTTPDLSENPSIAVLPFCNITGGPEQEYFSDGITEDIITELSRFRDLFVIARESSFTKKDHNATAQQLSESLGARYLLKGSLRSGEKQVRITARLIDTQTNHQLWGDHYDRTLQDIFAVQDELARKIVTTLIGRLEDAEVERAKQKAPDSLVAYDYLLQARKKLYQVTSRENMIQARELFNKAIELEPYYSQAFAGIALSHTLDAIVGWSDSAEESLQLALDIAQQAVMQDGNNNVAHWVLGEVSLFRKQFDQAATHLERALTLNPNDADVMTFYGYYLGCVGRHDEALDNINNAMRRNPFYPDWYSWMLGTVYFGMREYQNAIDALASVTKPNIMVRARLAASYAHVGKNEEAESQMKEILKLDPRFSLRAATEIVPLKDSQHVHNLADGMRKAGLPE